MKQIIIQALIIGIVVFGFIFFVWGQTNMKKLIFLVAASALLQGCSTWGSRWIIVKNCKQVEGEEKCVGKTLGWFE